MRFYVLILVLIGLMTSCKKNHDLENEQTLIGTWILKNESGGRLDYSTDYNEEALIWNFNNDPNVLTVENNDLNMVYLDFYHHLKTGTYDFDIQTENNNQILFVNDTQIGFITLTNENLIIDQKSAFNNFILTFEKTPQ